MTHPTDEELDALVKRMRDKGFISQREADAITALRVQLAEVKAERDHWRLMLEKAEECLVRSNARADRAEAALAAQIEADAGIITSRRAEMDAVGDALPHAVDRAVFREIVSLLNVVAASIRNQPHDRTALDRMLRAERENALREAADAFMDGSAPRMTILAMIEQP